MSSVIQSRPHGGFGSTDGLHAPSVNYPEGWGALKAAIASF
jgi:hypothetical protein